MELLGFERGTSKDCVEGALKILILSGGSAIKHSLQRTHLEALTKCKPVTVRNATELASVLEGASNHETYGAVPEVYIGANQDLAVVRDAWLMMAGNEALSSLRVRLLKPDLKHDSLNPEHLVIQIGDDNFINLQNKLELISKRMDMGSACLVLKSPPLFWPSSLYSFYIVKNTRNFINYIIGKVYLNDNSKILFLGESDRNYFKEIDIDFWKKAFSSSLPSILLVDEMFNVSPMRIMRRRDAASLFVFPERILPLSRAYFSRAFDVILGLNYSGQPTAAFVLGPNNEDIHRVREALEVFCPAVFVEPLIRGTWPFLHFVKRQAELFARKNAGCQTPPPMRFNERIYTFATQRNVHLLGKAIEQLDTIGSVIYTGSWFTPVIQKIRKKFTKLKWYCDTHDVFFVLDEDSNREEKRYLYSAKKQKSLEISLLQQADGIIAISNSDAEELMAVSANRQILIESGSFSYVATGVDVSSTPKDLRLGFIGTNNRNNQKCLKIVDGKWWPIIRNNFPEATLVVAGAICQSDEAKRLKENWGNSIELLGFVSVLSEFFVSVKAMLSPIAVQGGLNFKSVEALVAGRPLITNQLGSKCIGNAHPGLYVVSDDGGGIANVVRDLLTSEGNGGLHESIHLAALSRFGSSSAYKGLLEALNGF